MLPNPGGGSSSSGSGGARPLVVVPGAEVVEPPGEPEDVPVEVAPEAEPEERPPGRRQSQPSVHEWMSDWWEPMPSQKAWVPHHTRDRHALFVPVEVKDGPQVATLSKQRYTFVTFDDGTLDVVED